MCNASQQPNFSNVKIFSIQMFAIFCTHDFRYGYAIITRRVG